MSGRVTPFDPKEGQLAAIRVARGRAEPGLKDGGDTPLLQGPRIESKSFQPLDGHLNRPIGVHEGW